MREAEWIDRNEYPFGSHSFTLPMGRMHYVDEGSGEPVVMVHGNPAWSFLYRHMIKGLSPDFRCVTPDHIGFGLSDKPLDWSYLPEEHAKNLARLIEALELQDLTIVVQDWGGPIGLSYALEHPENVKRLIVMNTWMWSVKGDWYYQAFSKFMGGPIGRHLIRKKNFFVGGVMKKAMGDPARLTPHIHRHYFSALDKPEERKGCWTFPKEIVGSSRWLSSLWARREKIRDKPALLLWGMKDIAFREKELNRWLGLFTRPTTLRYSDVGHFVQEEKGEELCPVILEFMKR